MASPAVVVPNGVPATAMHANDDGVQARSNNGDMDSSASPSATLPAKRKRDEGAASGDAPASANQVLPEPPALTNVDKNVIRDYLAVLQKHDTKPSILSRAITESGASSEHQMKRQKSEDAEQKTSIAEKVAQGAYENVESIITDIKTSIEGQLAELRNTDNAAGPSSIEKEKVIAKTISFAKEVYGLFRRELSYPSPRPVPKILEELAELSMIPSNAGGSTVLTIYGEAPRYRPLYSSLHQGVDSEGKGSEIQLLQDQQLPVGVKTTKTLPYAFPSPADKDRKPKTLGELFPPPRNLQSLQPPKAPKSSTKGVHVGWHRPELTEKSKYRIGSYFSQSISTGRWLDYSNAAPSSQIMTKQRERAMSLAGRRPSMTEIEASEMESLFRGAFSSFAPSKDDSAAVISSGLISQTMWWQKHGKRSFDRLVGADVDEDENGDGDKSPIQVDLDEELIEKAIENWDDSLVDPSLEQACAHGIKTQEEKDADEILQDVSDLIQTLISYQKNRNLSLPNAATQSRYAADPAHSDMLTNGQPVQPDEEERATYDALKAQLSLIVQTLPPYVVARLNSDKLEELNISAKLEIRTDEYRGSMDEDEAAARARVASQPAAQAARPTSHRASGSYGQQYQGNRAPVANAQYYGGAQTPVRPGPMQQAPQSMPPTYNQRPPGYRQPNQYTKRYNTQTPQGQPAAYGQAAAYGTPTQNRAQFPQQQGYANMGTPNTQPRFSAYQPNTQSPQMAPHHNYHQQQQQGMQAHPPQYNNQYGNGAPAPRPVPSPHMPQQQHMQPQHSYRPQQGTPQRQPSFSGAAQPNMAPNPQARGYPPQQAPMMAQQQPQHAGGVGPAGSPGQFHPSAVNNMPQGGPPRTSSASGSAAPIPDMGGAMMLASPSPNPQQQSQPGVNGAAAPAMTNGAHPPPPMAGKGA